MRILVKNDYTYHHELRTRPDTTGMPLASDNVTRHVDQLIDELFTVGVLAEQLPALPDELRVEIAPIWSTEPAVEHIEVTLSTPAGDQQQVISRRFDSGPWVRASQQAVCQLREEGALAEDELAYRLLVAIRSDDTQRQLELRSLQPPRIVEQTLEDFGVRQLGTGSLQPERPVLVGARLMDEAIEACEAAGSNETGGAVLGKIVRLPQPLPQTDTRVVTILSTIVTDPRHSGDLTRFHISPEALAAAAEVADLRGLGEVVLTVFHTHGWGCGDCNEKPCPLAEGVPSVQDYELESLFPTKALLLPIAGRKQGAAGRRPILQIHGWRGGAMKPIRWQLYHD